MLHAIRNSSLFIKLVVMVSLALCPPILLGHLAGSYFISKYGYEDAENTVSSVAQLAAESPLVVEAMRTRQPEAFRQMTAFLETLTRASDVKFIVLIDMQGIRLSHPVMKARPLKGNPTYHRHAAHSDFRCGRSGPFLTRRATSWARLPQAFCPVISRRAWHA